MNRKQLKQRVTELEAEVQVANQLCNRQCTLVNELHRQVYDYASKWKSVISWVDDLQPQDPMRVIANGKQTISGTAQRESFQQPVRQRIPNVGVDGAPLFDAHNMYLFRLRVDKRVAEKLTVLVHYTGRDYYVTANYAEEIDKAELERQIAKMLTHELRGA